MEAFWGWPSLSLNVLFENQHKLDMDMWFQDPLPWFVLKYCGRTAIKAESS